MNKEKLQEQLEHIESEFEVFSRDTKQSIDELKKEINKPDEKEIVGCYRTKPKFEQEILYLTENGMVKSKCWFSSIDDRLKYNSGNCYPLSMRQHLENAIECREALMSDESVILGHECEVENDYQFIVVSQVSGRLLVERACLKYERRMYCFLGVKDVEFFINKYHDKLISMFLVGLL